MPSCVGWAGLRVERRTLGRAGGGTLLVPMGHSWSPCPGPGPAAWCGIGPWRGERPGWAFVCPAEGSAGCTLTPPPPLPLISFLFLPPPLPPQTVGSKHVFISMPSGVSSPQDEPGVGAGGGRDASLCPPALAQPGRPGGGGCGFLLGGALAAFPRGAGSRRRPGGCSGSVSTLLPRCNREVNIGSPWQPAEPGSRSWWPEKFSLSRVPRTGLCFLSVKISPTDGYRDA